MCKDVDNFSVFDDSIGELFFEATASCFIDVPPLQLDTRSNPRSQTIYGRLVETFGPYFRNYTSCFFEIFSFYTDTFFRQ